MGPKTPKPREAVFPILIDYFGGYRIGYAFPYKIGYPSSFFEYKCIYI